MADTSGRNRRQTTVGRATGSKTATGSNRRSGDRTGAQLTALGGRLGNDELKRRIDAGNATRDDILSFLCQRLDVIRQTQKREMVQTRHFNQRHWWKEVSDSHMAKLTKPRPAQWAEAARLYQEAAEQLCAGALGRGTALLEQAMTEERSCFDRLTTLVDVSDLRSECEMPGSTVGVRAHHTTAPCEPPEALDLAHVIRGVGREVKDPPVRKKVRAPWWALEEEEEEQEESDDPGGS